MSEKGLPPLQRHEKYEEWDEMKRAKYKFIWEYELYVKGSKTLNNIIIKPKILEKNRINCESVPRQFAKATLRK